MALQLSSSGGTTKQLKGIDEYIQLRTKGMPEQLIKRKMMYDGIKSPEIDSFFVNVMPTIPIKPSQSKPGSNTSSPTRAGRSFKPARIAPSQHISLDRGTSEYNIPSLRNGKLLSQTDSIRNVEYFKKLAEEKKSEQKRSTEDSSGASSGPRRSPVFGQGLKSIIRSSQEGKDQPPSSSSASSTNPPGFDFKGSPSEALVTPQMSHKKEGSISSVSTIAVKTANISSSSGTGRRSEHALSNRFTPPLPQNINTQKSSSIPQTNENEDSPSPPSSATSSSKGVKIPKLGPVAQSSSNSGHSSPTQQSPRSPKSLGPAVRMLAAFKGLFTSSKKLSTQLKDDHPTSQAKSRLTNVPAAPTPLSSSSSAATASKSSSGEDESSLMRSSTSRSGPPLPQLQASASIAPSSTSSSRAPTPVAEKLANSVSQLREMESMMRTVEKIQTDRGRTRTMSDIRPRAASEVRNSIVLDKFMAAVETIEENDENRPRDRRKSSVADRNSFIDMSGKMDANNIYDDGSSSSLQPGQMIRDASKRALQGGIDRLSGTSTTSTAMKRSKRIVTALQVIETSFLQLKEMEELAQRVDKISTENMRGSISAISGKGDGQRLSEVQKKKQREELSRAAAKLKADRIATEAICRKELISKWMAEILNDPSDADEAMAVKQQKQFDISVVMRSVEMIKSEVALPTDAPIISALRKSGTRVVADVQDSITSTSTSTSKKSLGRSNGGTKVGGPGRGPSSPQGTVPGRGGAGRGGGGGRGGDVAFFLSRAASEAPPSPITSP